MTQTLKTHIANFLNRFQKYVYSAFWQKWTKISQLKLAYYRLFQILVTLLQNVSPIKSRTFSKTCMKLWRNCHAFIAFHFGWNGFNLLTFPMSSYMQDNWVEPFLKMHISSFLLVDLETGKTHLCVLKSGQNKKGPKNGAAGKFFGPSYFVTALAW